MSHEVVSQRDCLDKPDGIQAHKNRTVGDDRRANKGNGNGQTDRQNRVEEIKSVNLNVRLTSTDVTTTGTLIASPQGPKTP